MQCGDNRFKIIEKAKKDLINSTNIKDSPEEMEVIDSILFRCWQMDWLNKYDNDNTKASEALECLENLKKQAIAFEHNELAIKVANGNTEIIKQNLLKLDFLEKAMDLPTNCFSIFKNRNGDEVTVMRREMHELYKKQEKVLNVIKEKGVDVGYLKTCKTLEDYNSNCWDDEEDFNKKLTQEEFVLLKEC